MDEGEAGPASMADPSVDAAGLFELLDNSRGNQGRDNVGSHGEMEDQGHTAQDGTISGSSNQISSTRYAMASCFCGKVRVGLCLAVTKSAVTLHRL